MASKVVQLTNAGGDKTFPVSAVEISSANTGSRTYTGFARLPKNTNYNYGTLLVSGVASVQSLGGSGSVIIQVRNTSTGTLSMDVSGVAPFAGDVTFGYWDGDDGYWYIGVSSPGYRYTMGVTIIQNHSNTARRITVDEYYPASTTAPTGWTRVPINIRFSDWAVATIRTSTASVTAVGWYRVAEINQGYLNSTAGIHPVGQISITGGYSNYKPSKGVFSFSSDGGSTYWNIVQLTGVLGASPTKIRLSSVGLIIYVDVYFSQTGNDTIDITVESTGVGDIDVHAPVAVADAPTGETIRASLDIGTITTGRVVTTT